MPCQDFRSQGASFGNGHKRFVYPRTEITRPRTVNRTSYSGQIPSQWVVARKTFHHHVRLPCPEKKSISRIPEIGAAFTIMSNEGASTSRHASCPLVATSYMTSEGNGKKSQVQSCGWAAVGHTLWRVRLWVLDFGYKRWGFLSMLWVLQRKTSAGQPSSYAHSSQDIFTVLHTQFAKTYSVFSGISIFS